MPRKASHECFHLIWHYAGEMRGKRFDDWEELETFSRRLIAAGLVPKVPEDCPTPYDEPKGHA